GLRRPDRRAVHAGGAHCGGRLVPLVERLRARRCGAHPPSPLLAWRPPRSWRRRGELTRSRVCLGVRDPLTPRPMHTIYGGQDMHEHHGVGE
ncbi:Hypothetical protein EMIHUDRAFT_355702, partial [Emiliania huxleyi CCMP1516]|uniref:Uncharacterized protein n=2 Tax=Emiliania huxleyi TaxID=2903 RepID=A0A0D3J2L9_EMIH1